MWQEKRMNWLLVRGRVGWAGSGQVDTRDRAVGIAVVEMIKKMKVRPRVRVTRTRLKSQDAQ